MKYHIESPGAQSVRAKLSNQAHVMMEDLKTAKIEASRQQKTERDAYDKSLSEKLMHGMENFPNETHENM
jgi:hypothetical protein